MKRTLPLVALLAATACSPDPATRFAQGRTAYDQHDFATAKTALADVLDRQPDNAPARLLYARTSLALGDGEAARSALTALPVAQRPGDYAALMGEAALLRGSPDDAVAALGGARDPAALRIRALAAIAGGDTARAATLFDEATAQAPRDARLLSDAARFRLGSGDVAGAQALVARALQADPGSYDAHLVDGQVSTARGDLAHAVRAYDDALGTWPGSLAALAGKAAVLGDLGRTTDMQALLDKLGEAGRKNLEIAYLQARAAAARNDWSTAHAILQAHERDLADNANAGMLYAQSFSRLGQPDQARAQLVPMVTRNPGNAVARRMLARVQLDLGDGEGAMRTLAPLIAGPAPGTGDLAMAAQAAQRGGRSDAAKPATGPQFPSPRALGAAMADADTALKAHNWATAAALYRQVLAATDGKNPLVLNNLAFAESELGNRDEALDHALRALAAAPGNASVMDTAGWLLFTTGKDRARGLQLLGDAAARAPSNAAIAAHLQAARGAR